jgi:CRP-like cAMP-binding protein
LSYGRHYCNSLQRHQDLTCIDRIDEYFAGSVRDDCKGRSAFDASVGLSGHATYAAADVINLSNQLLNHLPASTLEHWRPQLESVDLQIGEVIYAANVPLDFVYFPTSAVVSLLNLLESGSSAEIAVIGKEGIVGFALLLGGDSSPGYAIVQAAGHAYRVSAQFIKHEFGLEGAPMQVLLRYTQALITQMAQTAVCYRHHSLDQQLCRWLLFRLDRLQDANVEVTQELIARLLGVRRQGITASARKLQTAGLIQYARGKIIVLNRREIERRACECYSVVTTEYRRLLPTSP